MPWARELRGRPKLGLPLLFLMRKAWGWETGSRRRVTPGTSREFTGHWFNRGRDGRAWFLQVHPELLGWAVGHGHPPHRCAARAPLGAERSQEGRV